MPRLRQSEAMRRRPVPKAKTQAQSKRLPVNYDDPDHSECVAVSQHIAELMIADEWLEIADEISNWEAELASSPGGTRYHDVAVKTCLSGLQGLIEDAPRKALSDLDQAQIEVMHFVDTHRQMPDNHVLALLAARAHIAIGEACAADDWPEKERRAAWRKTAHHFIAAGKILAPFDAMALMSPLLAEAQYLQANGSPSGEDQLDQLFNIWIELDPTNSDIYSLHVAALVAHDRVSGDEILREADRALQRTEDTLGFGGYALFFTPLLNEYDSARELLDSELYASALMDLAANADNQTEVNHAAATLLAEVEAADADQVDGLQDALMLMVRQYLQVVYPRLWPISVDEVQEIVAEAAERMPDILPDEPTSFATDRAQGLAA